MNKKKQCLYIGIISILLAIGTGILFRPQTFDKTEISKDVTDFESIESAGYQIQGGNFTCLIDDPQVFIELAYENEIRIEFDSDSIDTEGVLVQLFYPVDNQYSLENSMTQTAYDKKNVLIFQGEQFTQSKIRIDMGQAEQENFSIQRIQVIQHYFSLQMKDVCFLLFLSAVFFILGLIVCKFRAWRLLLKLWRIPDKLPFIVSKLEKKWEYKGNIINVRFAIAILSQVAILGVMLLLGQIRYVVNDDTTMVAIAGGGYGTPSQYVINLHIWLGYLLKFLFQYLKGINWITVLYLAVYAYSFFVIDLVFFRKKQSAARFWMSLIIVNLCFLILISHFTFTVVAYTAFIAGSIAILYSFEDNIKINKHIILGIIALLCGFFVRAEAIKSIFIIIFIYGFIKYMQKRQIRYFVFLAASFALMITFSITNMSAYTKNQEQKEFIEWGELRSEALDCKKVEYNEEKFLERGISLAQYNAMYNAFYYVKDAVSNENMESLVELNSVTAKYNFDVVGFINYYFSFLISIFTFNNLYKTMFFLTLTLLLSFSKRRCWPFFGGILIGTLLVEAVFFMINRSLYRVIMPNYIFVTLLLLLCFEKNDKMFRWLKEHKINSKLMIYKLSLILVLIGIVGKMFNYNINKPNYSNERQAVLNYMEDNNNVLFIAGDANVFNIGISRSIWDYAGKDERWNLIGNWETYSIMYDELISSYHILDGNNIVEEAINNDNILIMTSQGTAFERNGEFILDLAKEFYDIDLQFQLVDIISKNSIDENNSEYWRTYKLVRRL